MFINIERLTNYLHSNQHYLKETIIIFADIFNVT